ncbi:DUF922 domain-containing protein [Aliivibrio finisterrensis]|uniref:DUF922 domain-containing protein n=3 Tax=Aliivibrio finisterrensis TaxID=511998 RepID=UPI001022744B|nr:DUF922 domain-containing protein [Aliivibrio finisterrensis]RYU66036.1 DUF922 domain-containing protein [Aliivibrio finisterrensis]
MKTMKFGAILLLVSPLSFSELLPFDFNKSYDVYELQGDTPENVENSFDKRAGFLKKNNFDGYTAWEYKFNVDDDSCEIKDFNLQIKYILPRLNILNSYSQSREDYRDYLEKLYRHEEQHCAITLSQLSKMYAIFINGQSKNCSKEIEKTYLIEDNITKFNQQFDTYTDHGAIELAVSPFGEDNYLKYCKIDFSPFINGI